MIYALINEPRYCRIACSHGHLVCLLGIGANMNFMTPLAEFRHWDWNETCRVVCKAPVMAQNPFQREFQTEKDTSEVKSMLIHSHPSKFSSMPNLSHNIAYHSNVKASTPVYLWSLNTAIFRCWRGRWLSSRNFEMTVSRFRVKWLDTCTELIVYLSSLGRCGSEGSHTSRMTPGERPNKLSTEYPMKCCRLNWNTTRLPAARRPNWINGKTSVSKRAKGCSKKGVRKRQ